MDMMYIYSYIYLICALILDDLFTGNETSWF